MWSYWKLYSSSTSLDKLLLALSVISSMAHGFATPLAIYFFGKIINTYQTSIFFPSRASAEIIKVVYCVLCVATVTVFAGALEIVSSTLLGERLAGQIFTSYLASLLNQEIGFHDLHTKTGEVVSSDMFLVQNAVGEKKQVAACIHHFSIFLGGTIISLICVWSLGLLGLAVSPVLLCAGALYMSFYSSYSETVSNAYRQASQEAEQALSQVRIVYSFVGEVSILSRVAQKLNKATELAAATGLSKGLGLGLALAIAYFAWALQFLYAGKLVGQGKLDAGTVFSMISTSLFSGKALADCLQALELVLNGNIAAAKFFQVIERESKIDSSHRKGNVAPAIRGHIEFSKVSFAYPSRPEVSIFSDLSLEIPQGKVVSVVGTSGSGKSSLISLIQRFYDPDKGEVRIDGTDIRKLQLQSLRKQIGLVSQEPVLFAMSIKHNIQLGKPDASDEEIKAAAKVANAHSFIMELPNGYETQVGDKGLKLSGGQRQRLAISRAVLKDPPIMLLDEATSALDAHSESVVQDALENSMQGRTTVVIAHRLSTIKNADKIVFLHEGKVVESGTHEELLREEGPYAYLVELQHVDATESSHNTPQTASTRHETSVMPTAQSLEKHFKTPPGAKEVMRWFLNCWSESSASTILGSLGASLSGLVAATFPLLICNVILRFLMGQVQEADAWIVAIAILAMGSMICSTLQYTYSYMSGARTSQEIQNRALTAILENEVGWFDSEENNSSTITMHLSKNSAAIRSALSDSYSYFLQNMATLFGAIGLGLACQWKMALLGMTTIPLQVIGSAVNHEFLNAGLSSNKLSSQEEAVRLVEEAVSSIRTIQSFCAEEKITSEFKQHLVQIKQRRLRRAYVAGSIYGASHGAVQAGNALLMWYGINQVIKGHLPMAGTLRAFTIVSFMSLNCVELLRVIPELCTGIQAIKTMFHYATRKTSIEPDSQHGFKLHEVKGCIEFEHVSFAYPQRPEQLVLDSFSISIPAGSSVAFVGPSGSGKSSLLALVLRFYDPTSGRILLDGRNIKQLNLRSMRQYMGYVQQEPALFSASVRENIAFGAEDAAEAEVVEAARLAGAHEFITALPQGYATQVGERGIQFSGGQRQRIAIARALLKKPAILLLDEATSALDAETERVVRMGLTKREKSVTSIVVAHRLSTVQRAQAIAVLKNGALVEIGTHSELQRNGGAYAHLLELEQM